MLEGQSQSLARLAASRIFLNFHQRIFSLYSTLWGEGGGGRGVRVDVNKELKFL